MSYKITGENRIITIPAYSDNYIYLYRYKHDDAFVVDPGSSEPVLKALQENSLNLTHSFATHHHLDHTAGIEDLCKKTNCKGIATNKGANIPLANINIHVLPTPGHTQDSVCYYVRPSCKQTGLLFTGDTLFIGGCGRLIECDSATMWSSLQRIADLPDDTLVYPGHDYTEENYEFVLTIEPNNKLAQRFLQDIKDWQKQGLLTVPSNIGHELVTNIFFRSNDPKIKAALNMSTATDTEVFAELRRRKNAF